MTKSLALGVLVWLVFKLTLAGAVTGAADQDKLPKERVSLVHVLGSKLYLRGYRIELDGKLFDYVGFSEWLAGQPYLYWLADGRFVYRGCDIDDWDDDGVPILVCKLPE